MQFRGLIQKVDKDSTKRCHRLGVNREVLKQIPDAMYSPKECELILGLPYKTMYRLIREKQVEAVKGIDGMVKVPRDELVRYAKKRERIEQAMNS